MHEMGLFKDLLRKIESISKEHQDKRIVKLKVKLGALSHLSPDHFLDHFDTFSIGTACEGASVEIIEEKDPDAPHAQEVVLESVEVEQ